MRLRICFRVASIERLRMKLKVEVLMWWQKKSLLVVILRWTGCGFGCRLGLIRRRGGPSLMASGIGCGGDGRRGISEARLDS